MTKIKYIQIENVNQLPKSKHGFANFYGGMYDPEDVARKLGAPEVYYMEHIFDRKKGRAKNKKATQYWIYYQDKEER